MKTFTRLLCVALSFCLFFACSEDEVDFSGDLKSGHLGSNKDKEVTVPFKVDYLGTYKDDTPPGNVIVDGVGNGTHVGNSTIHFDFWILSVSNDSVYYGNTYAYIVAANGDSLFVSIEGAVVLTPLDDHPDYVFNYWRDPFEILGGTGRFEGATGGGWSDDYNSTEDDNSHHHWEGTITMKKGKR